MGWVRINADILPLLEHVAPQLEEFSLEESTWIGENSRQNEAKASQFLPKMHRLRRLNLRKFGGPLDDLVKIEGSQLEYLDVSEARQLDADTLVNFLNQNNQLICLHLCPMPRQCLQLVAASTTSAINVPTAFLGFTKQEIRERQRYKEENGNIPLRRPKKGKTADLQTLIGQIGKMPKLRTLWLGYIPYTSHFLDISPIGNATELKHLHLKECMSLDGNSLKSMLGGILKDQLRQLSLLNCQRLEEFSALSLCTCLTQLDIEKSKALNDEALKGLAQHGRLRIVRINECPKVHDDGILSIVSKCTALKEVQKIILFDKTEDETLPFFKCYFFNFGNSYNN
ncbi:unnamed protein product [Meloidogyne enterolobii]|uniref:Uncharacterized protein n=1 Tax=Meloidogyne enterolobii TaxID=390850 RepID=A0ACB0YIL5_MELEN